MGSAIGGERGEKERQGGKGDMEEGGSWRVGCEGVVRKGENSFSDIGTVFTMFSNKKQDLLRWML